ncbi:ADP-ribosylation factor-like protein 13A [Anguilla anguilla]|uniref:ADP-ribosylation factor-like protein 13A n=1 Tax=Anguilla anguilla TaxID=7936 RepID=UPI0015B0E9B3|nr:ADP-ribosylation factor-like protein 13A [Anguilla anguilla]
MFNLMSNCCSWVSKFQQPVRKVTVLVVGLDNAGKTSMIRGIMKVFPGEVSPTQGCVRTELRVDNFLVTLLDMAGAPESRAAWRDHYSEAHGIVFVVDSSDRARIRVVREVLADLLKQPRVAGKPLLVLANKQDKMGALMGSELIEALTLEKLVNHSRSLCHIEPCSALLDVRRWSDRKTLQGLRWLLRAVSLDYPELCARVTRDSRQPRDPEEKNRRGKNEKGRAKPKEDRLHTSKPEIGQAQWPPKEKVPQPRSKLEPIQTVLEKENALKKKMKRKQQVNIKDAMKKSAGKREEEEEVGDAEAEQEQGGRKEKASTALIPRNSAKLTCKARVKEETSEHPESPDNVESKTEKGKGEKKKKRKKVKVKRKNKINTEQIPAGYSQPVDLSATFDLYRKAILALKARQDQGH